MSLVSLPPELRSICRRLTTAKTEQLPSLLPSLLKDLQRCQQPLSEPQDAKTTSSSSEAAVLVHKLRTHIGTLLNGRSLEGRFTAVALIKTYIEVGGWETLRVSEPWVRGLVSILQKRDPIAVKELCAIVLVRIFTLAHKFQTLIREIVTPFLPAFATACLQIVKPASTSKAAVKIPLSFTETVIEAFSVLIPLYPTTLRPSVAQIRSVTRPFIAPTSSDDELVPSSLQSSSRKLLARLHMTAAKNGGADEWAKHFQGLIKEFHETADQVFRAVLENWESTTGHNKQAPNFDAEPGNDSPSAEQLPQWSGILAGSERMMGLLASLADCLRCPTKVAVTIPISAATDMIARVSLIIPPVAGKDKSEYTQLNPAAGREEKDDLWAVLPDVQVAILQFARVLAQRLGRNFIPLAQDTLDQVVRMMDSSYRLPEVRSIAFALITDLLQLSGPTRSKPQVDALQLVTMTCCRDLLGAGGHLKAPKQQTSTTGQNGAKSRTASQNADAFLKSNAEDETVSVSFDAEHVAAAERLLTALFSHLPQQHINPDLRSRMLRTAILCQIKDAQVASILNPAKDKNGRTAQVILPYLHQQFPYDEAVEILRFNFRPIAGGARGGDALDAGNDDDDMEIDSEVPVEKPADGFTFDRPFQVTSTASVTQTATMSEPVVARTAPSAPAIAAEIQPSPFLPQPLVPAVVSPLAAASSTVPLKRKSEEAEALLASKRVDIAAADTPDPGFGTMGALVEDTLAKSAPAGAGQLTAADGKDDDDDSDDESVHLNMDLDSEGDEDEE
ncbi:hypothetical protein PFICI_05329 [Pestalotiopsis fici W106-1]|uniref:Pre-rRNA-processing protein RIX1 n=1 Tax=Pestalotiopsis fici (strain W106-1 / CGMCC3.15140) TaxID=1229662 RepID=W3XBI9_PESFW|nr:uncharacterized protein PFICI_05329 [Pestalotiopsis fici W106-1]ETS83453.1 hypothetical protein PFICI_05329 [Pestalotiopsis fici W106-1]